MSGNSHGLLASACAECGWRGFPGRLWCPCCGSGDVRDALVDQGRVEQVTTRRRALGRRLRGEVQVVLVGLDGGGHAVCRAVGAREGDAVSLSLENGAPVARRLR